MSQIQTLSFSQTLEHREGYKGVARVRALAPVPFDEPAELGGEDSAPCPMDYLLTAVGACLMSSLALGLQKKRVDGKLTIDVAGRVERDDEGLLRVAQIEVDIRVGADPADHKKVQGAYEVFKKFCIVSMSVARGIPLETRLHLEPA
ncbi:MAG: OsmC family protein [Deferrisomatales bacterium]